ncbi:MAG: serine/threonine protein kinase [Gammaproteobacteria bacterium]|jgi:serine/threonine protein kinase
MQYVKSIPLTAIINRNDVNLTRKLDIVIQTRRALSYAHRNGLVHRDIKPANILVDYDGHVRVVDFGIAGYFKKIKVLDDEEVQTVIMGTPRSMAPEQSNPNEDITHLSDIYALGVLMHELFVGCVQEELECRPEEIPRILWDIVQKCLNGDTKKRPQSTDELISGLLKLLNGRHLKALL